MTSIIDFVLRTLNIYDTSSLSRKWVNAEDYFFYFNKTKGTPIPSFDEVKEYLFQKG